MLKGPQTSVLQGRDALTLAIAGRRVGYADYGDPDGAPVIALHGTPGSRIMFALGDQLARERGLRLIAPERPGYGLSEYCPRSSLADTAADVQALADALGIGRCALIGVSGGCAHAIAAAASMLDRVQLMALVSPAGPVADFATMLSLSRLHRFVFVWLARRRKGPEALFTLMRLLVRHAPGLAKRGIRYRAPVSDRAILAREEIAANLIEALAEGLRPGIKGAVQDFRLLCAPWRLPLAEIIVPAAMWQGTDDHMVPAEAAFRLAQVLPNCRLDVIHGAGHYWVFEHFDAVLDTVEASLKA